MKVNVAIVDAFVDGDTGGNPAGVVLDADHLSDKQKLCIAREVGLSETAFVSQSNTADFKLDFYTPQKQIAHCGHATIATFSLLSQLGLVQEGNTSKETIDGYRDIEVFGNFAYMRQTEPKYRNFENDKIDIFDSVGISENQTISDPVIVNTGNSFLIFGVKSIKNLETIIPDYTRIESISEKYNLIGFYIYTLETNNTERDASARMFAPRFGIKEEAATGMAAGPLACFLHDYMSLDKEKFHIEQGYTMQPTSPSCIDIVLYREGQKIRSLKAGGIGNLSRYLEIEI